MAKPLSLRVLALQAALLITSDLPGQSIVAIDLLTGEIAEVNVKSGSVASVGFTGLDQLAWTGLTRDTQGILFGSYGYYHTPYAIYEIDPVSAIPSLTCQTTLRGVLGIAFDDMGSLYALNDPTAPITGPADLVRIDLQSGAATVIGGTHLIGPTSLVFHDGDLWTHAPATGLVRIDETTGSFADVNPNFVGPVISAELLCFSDAGTPYQLDAGLWVQDVLTGVPAFIGEAPHFGIFGGAAFLPGPAPPFALGTLGQTGGPMGAQTWGATPGGDVVLLAALGPAGVAQIPAGRPCAGTTIDLNATYRAAAVLRTDAQGHARAGPVRAPASIAGSLRLQALDLTTCTTSNLARVIY